MEKEKVELFKVYKQGGTYYASDTRDVENMFALYGFLKCVIKDMEEDLLSMMTKNDGADDDG